MKPTAYLWNIPDMPLDAKNPRYLYFYDPSAAASQIFKKDITPLYTRKDFDELVDEIKWLCTCFMGREEWDGTAEKERIKKLIAEFEDAE